MLEHEPDILMLVEPENYKSAAMAKKSHVKGLYVTQGWNDQHTAIRTEQPQTGSQPLQWFIVRASVATGQE